jgi:hypothetical protein
MLDEELDAAGLGLTANIFLDSDVSVLHVMLHRVLLPKAFVAVRTSVRLLISMYEHWKVDQLSVGV